MKDEKWLDSSENIDDDERTTMNSICGTITHGPTLIVPFCRNFHWLMISDCIWAVWVICNRQIPALAWLTGVQIRKKLFLARPSLKIRTASAIFLINLGIFRDYGLKTTFFRNKTFLFFKIESWKIQHLFENEFHETSQSFNTFS